MEEYSAPGAIANAQNLIEQGKSLAEIETGLLNSGHSIEDVAAVVAQLKQLQYRKQSRSGILLIALGVIFCVTGFIAVVTLAHPDAAFNFALYGMTGLGSTSILGGLFLILK